MRQAQPSTQDSVSGHGDLPIACANLRDGAGSRRGSLLFVTQAKRLSARVYRKCVAGEPQRRLVPKQQGECYSTLSDD